MRRGRLFAFSRFFVRRYIGRWQADVPERQGPAVYGCSHTNLLGPLAALCWLPAKFTSIPPMAFLSDIRLRLESPKSRV